jgi:hypothetical protein
MNDLVFSEEDVMKKLSGLKIDKSPGLDLLHPRVLKECCDVLACPLQLIFSKSISTGNIPADWKRAEVIALHKKAPCPNAEITDPSV